MTIDITKEARSEAVTSVQRYFQENLDSDIGNLAAGALLDYFLAEIGPLVYNRAVADVQEKLLARVMEVDIDIHKEEFGYWRNVDKLRRKV